MIWKNLFEELEIYIGGIAIHIGFRWTHHPQLSVLVPENLSFKVVAYSGITCYKLKQMEELFMYGDRPYSLAGHVMNRRIPIIINDLARDDDPDTKYWEKLSSDEFQARLDTRISNCSRNWLNRYKSLCINLYYF